MDDFPLVDVAVVLIARQGRLLLDYNPRWHAFTLPMSGLHDRPPATPKADPAPERPLDAALRAAAEVLGRPHPEGALTAVDADLQPFQQSERDGRWKRYTYRVFALTLAAGEEPRPVPGHHAAWLKPDELGDAHPVSPTVAHILGGIEASLLRRLLGAA
jgi:hypothetical protein